MQAAPRPKRCPAPPPVPFHWIGVLKDWELRCSSLAEALVCLWPDTFRTHAHLIGATGSGKTNLIHTLISLFLRLGISLLIIDPRGDLAQGTIELAARIGVDPSLVKFFNLREKERPVGFNPLAGSGEPHFRALGVLAAIEHQSASWGVQLAETLMNALLLLSEGGSSLTKLEHLLYDTQFRFILLERCTSDSVKAFWARYNGLSRERQEAMAAPVLNKVSLLFATESLRRMLGHPEPVDLGKHLNTPGSVTLVGLAIEQTHGAGWMTGSMFISAICREVFARIEISESKRNPTLLIADEFENFGMEGFHQILAEGRKFRLSLLLAHQTLAQLDSKTRSIVLGNCGVKLVFRVARQDADVLGRDLFGSSREFDFTTLPVGEAILWQRGQKPVHIEVNSPLFADVGELSPLAKDYMARLRDLTPVYPEVERPAPSGSKPPGDADKGPAASLEDWL